MKRLAVAAALVLGASAAVAQPRTTQAQARVYVWSALMTGAAHAIVSPDIELAPPLREKLALAPHAERDKVYEALVTLTRGRLLRVRAATLEEAEPVAEHAGGIPVFAVEGGVLPLLVAYDLERDHVAVVGLLGVPWKEPEPTPPAPIVVRAPPAFDLPAKSFILRPIYFAHADASLSARSVAGLEDAGLSKIVGASGVRYVVRGHSDRLESEKYRERLSEERAAAVRDYLVAKGVPPQDIRLVGFGASISMTACAQRVREVLISCLGPDRRATVEVISAPN